MNKRIFRKTVAFICAVSMVCSGMPAGAQAASINYDKYFDASSLTIAYSSQKAEGVISGYNSAKNSAYYAVTIPKEYSITNSVTGITTENCHIKGISADVFKGCSFSKLYINTYYEYSIGARAFQGADVDLERLPQDGLNAEFICKDNGVEGDGITEIGDYAFAGFKASSGSLYIDKINGKIGAHAFEGVKIGKQLTINGTLDEIGDYAFKNVSCSAMHIPDAKRMGTGAFQNTEIVRYTISGTAEEIGSQVFGGCEYFQEITLPNAPGSMKQVASDAFPDRSGVIVNIPAGYEDLSVYHFDQYQNLTYNLDESYTKDSAVYKQLAEQGANVIIKNDAGSKETEEPSQSPKITGKPSQEPDRTEAPSPEVSAKPTQTPKVTEIPSKTPEVSVKPTQTPAATQVPSQSPKVTERPTQTPGGTETPQQSPKVTSQPAEKTSETPAPTGSSRPAASPQGSERPEKTTVPSRQPDRTEDMEKISRPTTNPSKQTTVVLKKGTTIKVKGLKYKVKGKSTVICTGTEKKKSSCITIPEKIIYQGRKYQVTEIAPKAFYKNKKLKQLRIGKNVCKIGTSAFEQCTSLKKIFFGKNMQIIGKRAFYKDKKISRLTFYGKKLQKVGKRAFSRGRMTISIPKEESEQKYIRLIKGSY
ncbi:MAG: leucine-rich repeat protein [Lachnospiraceae bacterium]|nr:leucine-rich repeat protein [Lachnospiraceae bacterium]